LKPPIAAARWSLALAALLLGLSEWAKPAPGESPLTLTTATGTLHGSLRLPAAAGAKLPLVLIIAGSGPMGHSELSLIAMLADGLPPRLLRFSSDTAAATHFARP